MSNNELKQRVIAVMLFDGWAEYPNRWEKKDDRIYKDDDSMGMHWQLLRPFYHSSYDHLMPVWFNFRGMRVTEALESNQEFNYHIRTIACAITDTSKPIDAFEALSDGIMWWQKYKSQLK